MPSTDRARAAASQVTGSSANADVASATVATGGRSLEQVLLSTARQDPTGGASTVDDGEENADTAPTSWSFAARQRSECSRIARVFRYARQRMRQELRGLALDHAELLLGAVTRTVVTAAKGRGTAEGHTAPERLSVKHDGYNLEGEGDGLEEAQPLASQLGVPRQPEAGRHDGGKKNARRSGRNLRHEARPHDGWNTGCAMAVDEDGMGELSTLALDDSMLEGDADAGLEEKAGVGADTLIEWRKAFRQRVISTSGSRHPKEIGANRRYKRKTAREMPNR